MAWPCFHFVVVGRVVAVAAAAVVRVALPLLCCCTSFDCTGYKKMWWIYYGHNYPRQPLAVVVVVAEASGGW